MNTSPEGTDDHHESDCYEIRLRGHLNNRWAYWFEGLTITHEANGETRLTGAVADQAALYGLLKKVRDLGLPLVAVSQVKPNEPNSGQSLNCNRPTQETNR
jgi:hypothetical protein